MIAFSAPYQAVAFDTIRNDQYLPAFRSALDESRRNIERILSNTGLPDYENTIEALEYSLLELKRLELVFFNINSAETNKEIQQIAQEVSPLLSEFYNDITLNEALFSRVKTVYDQKERLSLSPESRKLLDETYKSFVRNGAGLNPEAKAVFRDTTRELSILTLKFEENQCLLSASDQGRGSERIARICHRCGSPGGKVKKPYRLGLYAQSSQLYGFSEIFG